MPDYTTSPQYSNKVRSTFLLGFTGSLFSSSTGLGIIAGVGFGLGFEFGLGLLVGLMGRLGLTVGLLNLNRVGATFVSEVGLDVLTGWVTASVWVWVGVGGGGSGGDEGVG